jgi:hypothetical protein
LYVRKNRDFSLHLNCWREDELIASWLLICPAKATLIDAGIPGISLRPEIGLQEARNRWHFLFQQIPDFAETVIAGREQA